MNITDKLLTSGKEHGRPGTGLTPKGVTVHYVGNPGSSAEGNRNYFEKGADGRYASAHYIIGLNGEILRCIPENERANHAGKSYGAKWDEMAKTNNSRYIGIECCHPDVSGKFNDNTYVALVALCADICKRYGFNPQKDVVRHYDITGKSCPLYYKNNSASWVQLLDDIAFALSSGAFVVNPTPTLRRGDKGQAVADMQALLNAGLLGTGTAALAVDGSFGLATESAVKAFQSSCGLAVDGVCGPKTWAALLAVETVKISNDTPIASKKTPVETTVDNLLARGAITDPLHWIGYLSGNTTTKPEYVKSVFDSLLIALAGCDTQ